MGQQKKGALVLKHGILAPQHPCMSLEKIFAQCLSFLLFILLLLLDNKEELKRRNSTL